ncbi:transcriptional regulator with XRE-family HTH domain [Brevibacillus aydinogluensis]|jgi:transcriptional regulator with XRE-family HTH domain|uniref:helix-turn-helix domain-containing protein n=1 Tax=Brevibacillus aydinogluensis TaxID=927786 RepID=UPI000E3A6A3C|nr:helix-turn-helix transcriptional regulator [Brevibacillus aydinogluensis]MDT3417002.1 transcriptional regulator with XRE-family HTH domain [Brevibacillus aydinogluensis]REK62636.1 MAG: transcriptional regulator [Brevibacillus sp.]
MLNDFGKHVRALRKQKGIGLNAFAERLGVSPAYLSNLETGKTKTIHLQILDHLQKELALLPIASHVAQSEAELRIQRMSNRLIELYRKNPREAMYLLSIVEQGIDLFLPENDSPTFQH